MGAVATVPWPTSGKIRVDRRQIYSEEGAGLPFVPHENLYRTKQGFCDLAGAVKPSAAPGAERVRASG